MKKFDTLDFIPTISDSEEDVPDLDLSDEELGSSEVVNTTNHKQQKKGLTKNKNKNRKRLDEDVHEDINADFTFHLDDSNQYDTKFDGWNFDGDNDDNGTNNDKKDVDLDKIIRRKGGLIKMAHIESDNDDDNDEKEKDSKEELEVHQDKDEDDDELAMDGFGMGAPINASENESDEDENKNSENDSNQDDTSISGDDDVGGKSIDEQEDNEEDEEDDSAEAKAEFYAPETEGEEAKQQVHKTFNSLSLSRPVLKGLSQLGYVKPSPIQSATIPIALLGKDIIAGAVTGSGKTAAFMIPIIERLLFKPSKIASTRVVVLTPTRELAIQISDVAKRIGKFVSGLTFGLAVGGLNLRQQEQALKTRPDIVIATPGRFIDHIRNSASFNVDSVEILVLDEADRMLEEGFQDELKEIMTLLPSKRQTLLFSATMNSKIKQLVSLSLKKPVRIMIDPPKQAASRLTQEFVRIRKRDHLKPALLFSLLRELDPQGQRRIVVFVARKETAHRLRIILGLLGMSVAELHGSLTQEQRLDSVNKFKSLEVPVLICTDLASRGLDIPKIEVVINYDMPKTYEIYLHRVGRTARAGREGRSVTFVGESSQERSVVRAAIKSVEDTNQTNNNSGRALGRNVNWSKVEEINSLVDKSKDVVEEILVEEKEEKEILRAEMELKKGENMLKYKDEIQARPKRTWFQTETEKKNAKVLNVLAKQKKTVNSKKRKREEALEVSGRLYKKTQKDRIKEQLRSQRGKKSGKSSKKKGKK